jgi:hypothetical protein
VGAAVVVDACTSVEVGVAATSSSPDEHAAIVIAIAAVTAIDDLVV